MSSPRASLTSAVTGRFDDREESLEGIPPVLIHAGTEHRRRQWVVPEAPADSPSTWNDWLLPWLVAMTKRLRAASTGRTRCHSRRGHRSSRGRADPLRYGGPLRGDQAGAAGNNDHWRADRALIRVRSGITVLMSMTPTRKSPDCRCTAQRIADNLRHRSRRRACAPQPRSPSLQRSRW